MNNTLNSERIHIGFFGMRNAGKSSLVNAITNQEVSVVSNIKGTTTDPVKKSMELLPLGPVVIIDTPGFDDEGELGIKRVQKTRELLGSVDIAVLVIDGTVGKTHLDEELIKLFEAGKTPYIIAANKADIKPSSLENAILVSAKTGEGIEELKKALAEKKPQKEKVIISDLINEGDIVLLVTPIDEAAPKGRLILPQQLVLRDILDSKATAIVCQDTELKSSLSALKNAPALVITDSQVFGKVANQIPADIPLTSFSILMARYKGELDRLISGARALGSLKNGDRVLISEGCTHHRQCNDIGTVKMPKWIENFSGSVPDFHFTSGGEFPENIEGFKVVVHCGGCMLNDKEMKKRTEICNRSNVPIVNYGIAIAFMNGILKRSLEIFGDIYKTL